MELVKMYTDELYASKEEVKVSIGNAGLEKVWIQIQEYRKQFRIDCQLMNHKCYFVLTPYIFQRILEKQSELISSYILLSFKEYERHLFKILLRYNMPLHYHSFIKIHPLIQIFIVIKNVRTPIKEELVDLICEAYGYQNYNRLFLDNQYCLNHESDLDITRPFLEWLDSVCNQVKSNMISSSSHIEWDVSQLLRVHPEMCHNQCNFYFNHHLYGHYYSIEDYIQFCGTSYETARTHLQKMVDIGWYRKIKIGKKFVYTIVL